MNRKIYRICLVLLILVAVAGGVWYYGVLQRHQMTPTEGTLVWEDTGADIGVNDTL